MARGSAAAVPHLVPGDPFVLTRRGDSGVEVRAASLVVYQSPGPTDDLVTFRVVSTLTDDVAHLAALAGERAVEGIKGYGLVPAVQVGGVPDFDADRVADLIPHLAAGLPNLERRT